MKVQFSAYPAYSSAKISRVQASRMKVSSLNISEPLTPGVRVSFSGSAKKNKRQILSIANSDSKLGISAYSDATSKKTRAITSNLRRYLKMDSRVVLPYFSFDNKDGLIKVAKMQYRPGTGKRVNELPTSAFKTVPIDYTLEEGERFVIQNRPIKGKSRFVELEPTAISGKITRLKTEALEGKSVPYRMFKAINLPGRPDGVTRYILHTPKMAVFDSAKAAEAARDLSWNDFSKAAIDALPQMNSRQFSNFNPASLVLHRRMSFPALFSIADLSASGDSYYNQLRVHPLMYMPENVNFGTYKNPLQFLRMVANTSDLEELKKLPEYDFIADVDRNFSKATQEDIKRVKEILAPYLAPFEDENGGYSLKKIAARSQETNPEKILLEKLGGSYSKRAKAATEGTITPFNRVIDMSGVRKLTETAQEALKAARASFWGRVITTTAFFISVGGIAGMVYLSVKKPSYND